MTPYDLDDGPGPIAQPDEEIVTVEEATPETCRAMALDYIDKAAHADSLEHMRAYMESALIWARGADW